MVETNRLAYQIIQDLEELEGEYQISQIFQQSQLLAHYYRCLNMNNSDSGSLPTPTRAELIEHYNFQVNRLILLTHEAEFSHPPLLFESIGNSIQQTEAQINFRNRMERLFTTLGRAMTILMQLCMEREYSQQSISRPFQRLKESQPFRQYVLDLYSPIGETDWLVSGCWKDIRNYTEKHTLIESIIISQLIKQEVVHDNERLYWPKKIRASNGSIINTRFLEWDPDIPDLKTFVIHYWPFGAVHSFLSTYHGIRDSVLEDLKINTQKSLFPTRRINRYSVSFRDGIYDIQHHRFMPYVESYIESYIDDNSGSVDIYTTPRQSSTIPSSTIQSSMRQQSQQPLRGFQNFINKGYSFNFIDDDMTYYSQFQRAEDIIDYSWEHDLPIIYVLKVQGFKKDDDLLWTLGLLGRCLYQVGYDKWELCVSLVGIAQSGKSSIISFFEKLLGDENIGVLENIGETIFGMEGLMNKLMIIATELTLSNNMDKTKLLRMLSGETISIARKFKKPTNIRWKTPVMIAGNENFIGTETQGQFSRRIAKIAFRIKPNNQEHNSYIVDRLKQGLDIPETLVLLNLCYKRILELSNGCNFVSIWDIVPPRLYKEHQTLMLELNPLLRFLHYEPNIRVGPSTNDIACPEKEIRRRFMEYLQTNNLPKVIWNSSIYEMVFSELKIFKKTYTTGTHLTTTNGKHMGIVMLVGIQISTKHWSNPVLYFIRSSYVIQDPDSNIPLIGFYQELLHYQRACCPLEEVESILLEECYEELNAILSREANAHLEKLNTTNEVIICGIKIVS